jgi:hypothetical protein
MKTEDEKLEIKGATGRIEEACTARARLWVRGLIWLRVYASSSELDQRLSVALSAREGLSFVHDGTSVVR